MKEIQLNNGLVALVDDEDFEYLNQWKWRVSNGYAARDVWKTPSKRTTIQMHRIIMNTPDGFETDHISGNRLDNQRSNLRICTHGQNMMNVKTPRHNTSGYKGVSWNKKKEKWYAQIRVHRKTIFIGYFDLLGDAAESYNIAAKKYHNEFARINELPET